MATRKQRYDVALNGQGLILASKPETPKIVVRQDDVFGQRFAQGDRDYNDLAKWWYFAQSDWSGGFKDSVAWTNDAKFYYETNIDSYSEVGAIKLAQDAALLQDLGSSRTINTGAEGFLGTTALQTVGTDTGGGTKAIVWANIGGTWTDESSATFPTTVSRINHELFRLGNLWSLNYISGSTYCVTYSSTLGTWVDVTANIESTGAAGGAIRQATCGVNASTGILYLFVCNALSNRWSLVKTAATSPTLDADWTRLLNQDPSPNLPIAAVEYNSLIYYLMNDGEFRVYSPAGASDTFITKFTGSSFTLGADYRRLQVANNKIYITTNSEIWTYDGSNLDRVYIRDANKVNINDATGVLATGGLPVKNNIYWSNLVDVPNSSGEDIFHNWIKGNADTATTSFRPIFSDSNNNIYGIDTNAPSKLYEISDGGSLYKGTADKNYTVFNNFDKVSAIDKLAYSIDLIFKTLASGQKISVEYTTGELDNSTSWTVLGSASYTADGAVTQKTLYFGDAVLFKKVWFRVKLEGNTSTTPKLYDVVLAYLPMPDYRLRWDFTVKCEDQMQRKDQSKEPKNGIWLRNLLMQSWLTKSILTFEDFDADGYDSVSGSLTATATTITVTGNTDQFPEIGRLLIESEEIFYTGKTKNTFTGCTRGARGTNKSAHSSTTPISMGHRIIVRNYQEELIIANEPGKAEYLITLTLSEV